MWSPIRRSGIKSRIPETEYKEGELAEKTSKLIEGAVKGMDKKEVNIFIQFTDGNILEIGSLELEDENHEIVTQIIQTESEDDKRLFAAFITGRVE